MLNPLPSAKIALLLAVVPFLYGFGSTPAVLAADCATVAAVRFYDASGQTPVFVAMDPLKKFAYVANPGSDTVSLYRIDAATGVLTHRQDLAAGPGQRAIAITQGAALIRYTPKFAYVSKKSRTKAVALECPSRGI